jgi:PAS domain S-box-containing protein
MNRAVVRYAWPVLLTAAALGVRTLLNPWLHDVVPFATFYVSVTLTAILGGFRPGLLAIVLGTLAAVYFFIPPIHELWIASGEHAVMLALDVTVAFALVVLADRQRRAAAEAAEGRRMLEAVMEYVPEGLAILEAPDARVRTASRHGAELIGTVQESVIHKTLADFMASFFHADGKTPAQLEEMPGIRAIRHGEITADEEWIVKRPDGTTSVVLAGAAPIRDGKGRIRGAVVAARDITDRKRLQERLRESAKMESLGILAGGIAHDFNNLLTSILGHASLLTKDLAEGTTAWRYTQEISKAAEDAARLSRQMLAYSGHGRFLVEPLNLSECIRRLAPRIESSVPPIVQLRFDLAIDLPPIEADASQLCELILSLVRNGVEAIEPNAGLVTVATRLVPAEEVDVRTPLLREDIQPGTYVALDVSDTGSGMNEETVARMFDPFFTTKFPGRGLGLAVVQGVVRGHKGAILVYSAPGLGTTIRTLFPAGVRGPAGHNPQSRALSL